MKVSSGVRACLGLRRPGTARPSHSSRLKTAGFTLIELVCVLGIIGVLASIAIPHFTNFLIRARRSEAYLGLKGVHVAQTTFFTEVGRYGSSFDEIGFEMLGATRVDEKTIDGPAYRFEMDTYAYGGIPQGNFWAMATGDLIGEDPVFDVLLLESHVIIKE